MPGLLIGVVANRAGVSPPTIRYYEEIGLLPPPSRTGSGYRRYAETTIEELRFIRKAQALGFSLEEIGEVLRLSRSGRSACSHVLTLARQHLVATEERIRQLVRFRDRLAAEVARWNGDAAPTCTGLCQIIVTAGESPLENVNRRLKPRRATRQGKAERRT
jgi:DNA-binding transcriptional MerR regulator